MPHTADTKARRAITRPPPRNREKAVVTGRAKRSCWAGQPGQPTKPHPRGQLEGGRRSYPAQHRPGGDQKKSRFETAPPGKGHTAEGCQSKLAGAEWSGPSPLETGVKDRIAGGTRKPPSPRGSAHRPLIFGRPRARRHRGGRRPPDHSRVQEGAAARLRQAIRRCLRD
jgi:hypothetical protein